ncbi:large subunit ribosomal protein L21e [Nematocida minor]|uniref:large subunit ribosomal protein L21e n=1 Tax=Nematocida minor TaxID=1912983 RepID=UPI00221EDB2F|nr:large subunit ribosomal protein L21e [Nematocida minor]XP_051332097.1 large subunit ribosomal protein L21e [Nematocida minor]KAI5188827.1 large subunit ribosomal protein L21e [Nematocida minor]KAI5188931.1 large subunit ribosomal protein L21e [Nematocida minor]
MRSKGYRSNTRSTFKKEYNQQRIPQTTTILNQYKRGDYVDINVDSAIHKGMPHKTFIGKTGRVYAVFKTSVGIALTKRIGNRMHVKQVITRIEHVRPSNCQKEKIARDNYREEHGVAPPKPLPEGPRQAFTLSLEENTPVVLKPNTHYAM